MPFNRPTLTELRSRNQAFIQSELKNIGALLRFSNLGILGDADAGLAYLHYGYLDWIAKQGVPFTATDENMAAWAALKNVTRKPATAATCPAVTLTGTSEATLSAGVVLNRSDGYQYTLDAGITIGTDGIASGSITAVLPDPTEDTTGGGEAGNAPINTILTLDAAASGIDSQATAAAAITGGADIEREDAFRSRMLLAYQNTPQGGNDDDYESWALTVSGVTRAWTAPRLMGAGTVGVYIMLDSDSTSNDGGFPTGTDGISSLDSWGAVKATGDQGRVADYIYPLQPVTAVVYVCSPIKTLVNFSISGLSSAGSDITSAIAAAIDNVFFEYGVPGGTIYLSDILAAIADISGTEGFILTAPVANIVMPTGGMPVRGTVTYL
ncbi:baseplate J/gp47 family protein [Martelella alba]|uniref:Baseplate J/gp47 family protein n=1 Tax=Martelella alba TaxID=2590451 RepID=A0ABY2SG21_9HYPH|nr:baseplate J/gp47 family protein [Martelella alba]TKI02903.1 baseplate J/gp47 family protein [Martelella alba]